jgi:hypothetical protein
MTKLIQMTLAGVLVCSCLFAFSMNIAQGNSITMAANYEYSGGIPPAGITPWIVAIFDDHGSTGMVTLTLSTPHLTGPEFVSQWDFNLDPALDPANLSFSTPIKTGSFDTPTIGQQADFFKADGDGKYDFEFLFATSGDVNNRFTLGDSISYDISMAGITANSFNFLSLPAGGHGPYLMAAHVQNTPNGGGGSGWVTQVPEPSALMLLGMGVAGLWFYARRQRAA